MLNEKEKGTPDYRRYLFILIAASAIIRIIAAAFTELGNDEAYYWTYALFPQLSYFDHPPMVGLLIRATTLNLILNHELFVRLGAIISGSLNLWLIFRIGRYIKDSRTGLYAAFLYAGSLYGSVISGLFILPDSPQVVFWLITLFFLIKSITKQPGEERAKYYLLLAGLITGLAILSKYHSVFLWFGALLYILFYNRSWLKQKELYISIFITALFTIPILLWNAENNFISFTFHSGRLGLFSGELNLKTLLTEILGQIFYNNPINFFLVIAAMVLLIQKDFEIDKGYKRLLLLTGLPIIITFILFSLTRSTFPHWAAPGYFSLILITSVWLSSKERKNIVPLSLKFSMGLTVLIIIGAIVITNINLKKISEKELSEEPHNIGSDDVTLEMYGWKQIGHKFKQLNDSLVNAGLMPAGAPVISSKWFEAAHLEYYAAYPLNKDVYCFSSLIDIRNYKWFNNKRPAIKQGMNAYFIITSHDFRVPGIIFQEDYKAIGEPWIIQVRRGDEIAEYAFVYKLIKLKE